MRSLLTQHTGVTRETEGSRCRSRQQASLRNHSGADIAVSEVGVEDLHSGGGQGAAAAAPFDDDGQSDLRVLIGGKADKDAVIGGSLAANFSASNPASVS